jgi:hypothetical protein
MKKGLAMPSHKRVAQAAVENYQKEPAAVERERP